MNQDDGDPTRQPRRVWSDLGPRLSSAAVLIALTIASLVLGGYVFAVVVGAVFAGVYREWETMVTRAPLGTLSWALIGVVAVAGALLPLFGPAGFAMAIGAGCLIALTGGSEHIGWRVGGLAFIGLVLFAIIAARGTSDLGLWAGVYLGTTVWMTDSAAFFAGRQIGGEKLAPDISPSKTWSGALGGLALGAISGTVIWSLAVDSPLWIGALLSIVISILGQLGDLSESAIKRNFRIKDSGDIIPGHGGLMDRLDSMTFAAVFALILGLSRGGIDGVAQGLLVW